VATIVRLILIHSITTIERNTAIIATTIIILTLGLVRAITTTITEIRRIVRLTDTTTTTDITLVTHINQEVPTIVTTTEEIILLEAVVVRFVTNLVVLFTVLT